MINVASIPSAHVYVRHLAHPSAGAGSVVRLADPPSGESADSPWWPPRMLSRTWICEHAAEFDVMHIHFGFDALSPEDLEDVAAALREHDKPLVVTVHDLRNPHHDAALLHDAQLGVLVDAADALITLTPGAAAEIRHRWGREATVLPHPQVVPDEWLVRDRPERGEFVVGIHAKSLRANMDPSPLIDALVTALPGMPGARLRVDAHTDVMTAGFVRHDAGFSERVTSLAQQGLLELQVHDYFSDDELWAYLLGLDVSVLPYQFGTHSGWLEACHDLGTWVVAPDCGFYAEQRPTLSYSATGPTRLTSLVDAVRSAHDRWLSGESASRATATERHAERVSLARAHEAIYSAVRTLAA
ncbi:MULTISPECIES: glycosyltransferase family 1 protein [unclassified Knoellia]|uniref:glycosyltransferase family 1 protein n=1 Tax=Knoellia altitudinis TaxID=3404795 RepID=UPI00361AA8B6